MRRIRIIPLLLMQEGGLYKTVRFSKPVYIGDPINTVKIFNDKEVDEVIVVDISASRNKTAPNFKVLEELASEAFMPMGYGGGIASVSDMRKIVFLGFEKVIVNTVSLVNKNILKEGVALLGSQSIVVSVDYKKNVFGRSTVYATSGKKNSGIDPVNFAKEMEDCGVGELILHSIDRDGTYASYDFDMIQKVSSAVSIPIIACGGASDIGDFLKAVQAGASAVAAGSLFVYKGVHRAVLLNYPPQDELMRSLFTKI